MSQTKGLCFQLGLMKKMCAKEMFDLLDHLFLLQKTLKQLPGFGDCGVLLLKQGITALQHPSIQVLQGGVSFGST